MYYHFCFSPTGGTEKAASILARSISSTWEHVDLCKPVNAPALTQEDICLVSVPSYGGRVPGTAVERLRPIQGNGARAILVCAYGNRAWEDTLTELQVTLESCGFVCVAAAAAVAEHSIFRQFAAGRPDQEDTQQLECFAAKIQKKLDSGDRTTPALPGNHGTYREYASVPFKPEGNNRCVHCGLCAKSCPVSAIDPENPQKTDKNLCISCMLCVQLCSKHARDLNPLLLKGAGLAMKKKFSERKANDLFL